jgi:two-component system sensor histidine kinase BaeS
VYPTIAIGAVVAVLLNFLFVTLALRPLRAVRAATQSMASGAAPSPIESRSHDEIGEVADSVNELARSLKRLEDLRRQVTNDVAHELRTPLHSLLGLKTFVNLVDGLGHSASPV